MKIITGNTIYVQISDILYLHGENMNLPTSIFKKTFENRTINDFNEFVKFDTTEEVEFFNKFDWLIDYYDIKDLSEEELTTSIQSMEKEQNDIAKKMISMPLEERNQNTDMDYQCELLDLKMYSLKSILWLKQGQIKLPLPDGIDLPSGCIQEKGAKNLIKTIVNKKKT